MKTRHRRLAKFGRLACWERLESRRLMAAITAVMDGDDLIITGDDLSDTLWVQNVEDQTVVLRGLGPSDRRSGTTINGIDTTFNDVRFPNVTGAIIIDLRGGDDRFFVTIGRYEGPFSVALGTGDDYAEIGSNQSLTMASQLLVQLGEGSDQYIEANTRVEGFQRLDGGGANDAITFRSSFIAEGLLIDGAAGFDAIRIEQTTIGAFTGVLGGGEADRIEAIYSAFTQGVSILGGAGGDLVDLAGCRFDTTLFVALEADFGIATVQGCIIATDAYLTAAGQANLRFAGSTARRLEIATGPSNDAVTLEGSVVDEVFARLGAGDDQLRVTATRVVLGGLFDGESGRDSLFERGNLLPAVQRLNFERQELG